MFHIDSIKRQADNNIHFLAKTLLKKDLAPYRLPPAGQPYSTVDCLYEDLDRHLRNNEINEAENLLFDRAEPGSLAFLHLALDFYSQLNNMPQADLIAVNYTPEEILEGLDDLANLFDMILPN